LHQDQHVSQALGSDRHRLHRADRPLDPARDRALREGEEAQDELRFVDKPEDGGTVLEINPPSYSRRRRAQSICLRRNVGTSNLSSSSWNCIAGLRSGAGSSSRLFRCQVGASRSSTIVPRWTIFLFRGTAFALVKFASEGFLCSSRSPKPVAMTVTRISSFMRSSMTAPKMMLASSWASS